MTGVLKKIHRLLGGVDLTPDQQTRLQRWQRLQGTDLATPFDTARFVVVDVESTGLDLIKDRLIAIGACAVVGGRIELVQSFEVVLRQTQVSSRENILIHGIGGEAQRDGRPPVEALLDFLEFVGKSPLVAFHVTFDQTMINKTLREYLGLNLKHPWLDLAYLMPALMPTLRHRYRALDDWTGHFRIENYSRHSALADALVTAQLMLVALPLAESKRCHHYKALQDLEQAHRWVTWGR